MGLFDFYLQRYAFPQQFTSANPVSDVGIIVVIPAIDEPNLLTTLKSLLSAKKIKTLIEVIIVINSSDKSSAGLVARNRRYYEEAKEFAQKYSNNHIKFLPVLVENLRAKHAGAGWARKIGMDEAVRRFNALGKNGVIVNLDADCRVEENYFEAINDYFENQPKQFAANIYFEHPIEGDEFDKNVYDLIYQYELHLRYNVQMLIHIGFPYAFHTLGSAFAVRAVAYTKVNGMNRRTAGEDFYFLHKLTQLGTLGDITGTCVYPSPRPSFRVPFGTGALIKQSLEQKVFSVLTYSPEIYRQLGEFWKLLPDIYTENVDVKDNVGTTLCSFLEQNSYHSKISEIKKNTSNYISFRNRFFQWFNGFKIVKFQNFASEFYKKQPVLQAARYLVKDKIDDRGLLEFYRQLDKNRSC